MKIAVIGTGAVGGYYGAKLIQAGFNVTFIGTAKSSEIIKENGLYVKSVNGDIDLKNPKISANITDIKGADIILLCTKSYHTEEIAKNIKEKVNDEAIIISLQNGVENEQILASILGKERVIGSTIFVFTDSPKAGYVAHSGSGTIILGELNGQETERIKNLEKMFNQSGIPAKISSNIMRDLWKKMFINAAYNGFTAAIGNTLEGIQSIPEAKQAYYDILKECQMVANAEGMEIEDSEVEKIMERFNQDNFQNVKSSTLQDLEKSKPVEIDAIQGAVVRIAKKHGLKAPLNNLIYSLIKLKTINF